MDPLTIGMLGCAVLVILLMLSVPVAFTLLLVGFFGVTLTVGLSSAIGLMTTTPFFVGGQYSLTPLPLFVLMASLILFAGMGSELYEAGAKWLHKVPGGLGIATTLASTALGTLTGSSLVTAVLFIKVAVPEMTKRGYNSVFAHGLTCASGVIGMLIPPSMLAIIYGVLAEESIAKLFLAGVIPGCLTALGFSLLIFFKVKLNPSLAPPTEEVFTLKERVRALYNIWPVVVVAVVMLVGIFTGIFTVTEGGAAGVFAVFLIILFRRKMTWNIVKLSTLDTAKTSAMIFLLIIGATIFSRFVTITGVTAYFVDIIGQSGLPGWVILTGLMIMYVVLGCFLDPASIICITLPLVLPLVTEFGWDPIYFAMLVIYNMHIGTITPPVGLTLFAAKGAAQDDVSFGDIVKGIMPFVLVECVIMVILMVFEPVTIGLAAFM